jgi:hypothetical protein
MSTDVFRTLALVQKFSFRHRQKQNEYIHTVRSYEQRDVTPTRKAELPEGLTHCS